LGVNPYIPYKDKQKTANQKTFKELLFNILD